MLANRLEDILYFISIINYGSLNKAAINLNISTITIRRFIKKLEADLDRQLLLSITPDFVMTPFALELIAKFQSEIIEIDKDISQLMDDEASYKSTLKIAIPRFISHMIMPYLIGEFCQSYPNISLEIDYVNPYAYFNNNLLNYDLILSGYAPQNHQFYVTKLGDFYGRLYCNKAYAKKYGTPTTIQELSTVHGRRIVSFTDKPIKIINITNETEFAEIYDSRIVSTTMSSDAYIKTGEYIVFSMQPAYLEYHDDVISILGGRYAAKFEFCLLRNRSSNHSSVAVMQKILVREIARHNLADVSTKRRSRS